MKRTDSITPPTRTARRLTRERLRLLVRDLVLGGEPVPEWHDQAACRGMGDELFFPPSEGGALGVARVAEAKAVCAGCPVRVTCLADALTRESPSARYGVYGGLSAVERGRLYVELRQHARDADALAEPTEAVA